MLYTPVNKVRSRLRKEKEMAAAQADMDADDQGYVTAVKTVNAYFDNCSCSDPMTHSIPKSQVGASVPRFVNMFKSLGYAVEETDTDVLITC